MGTTNSGKLVESCAYHSPIGVLRLYATDCGICGLALSKGADKNTLDFQMATADQQDPKRSDLLDEATLQLDEYFAGMRTVFDIPLDIITGTPYQQKVWRALRKIPYGSTWSYKKLATKVGNPRAARAVGGANNKNPIALILPCHRVIGSSGELVGFGGGLDVKKQLLDLEAGEITLPS